MSAETTRTPGIFARTIDQVIEAVAPSWAIRRNYARSVLYGWGNDQQGRSQGCRTVASTVEVEVRRDRVANLVAARHLMNTNAYAVGSVNSITGNVIGNGIRLESRIRKSSRSNEPGSLDRRVNRMAEKAFTDWAKHCDLTGTRSLMTIQRQTYKERWIANDVFIRRHFVTDGRPVPLGLEVIASELLSNRDDDSQGIRQGVEFNELGRPVAYHFLKAEGSLEEMRVPAAEIVHVFRPHRVGAIRGLSPMTPVARSFDGLRKYLDHEVRRAEIASAFVFMHKKATPGYSTLNTPAGSPTKDSAGNPLSTLSEGGGIMITGGQNDSLEAVAPSIQGTAFAPFVELILRQIATGLGISYELLARDFTKTNFSSAKQSSLEDRRQWEPEQQEFINEALSVIWSWFVEDAQLAGLEPFSSARPEWPVNWIPPGWAWIDPNKEADATEKAIGLGVTSHIDAASSRGEDFFDNIDKKAEAEAYAKSRGTEIRTGVDPTPDPADEEDDDDVNEPNKKKKAGAPAQAGRDWPSWGE